MVTEDRGRLMKKNIRGGRNKGGTEDRRMSHPIAPKGHQNQEDKENVRKGYRIVLAYSNSKERSFDSNATYKTDREIRLKVLGHSVHGQIFSFFPFPFLLLSSFFWKKFAFFSVRLLLLLVTALGKLSNANSIL